MENYRVAEFVNSGAYGSVHKAQCLKTGRPVALKVVYVTPDTRACAETEVALSMRLRHPNIIHTHDMFKLRDGNYVLVQELAESDLFEFINERGFGCNEAVLKAVFSQMAAGVAYMHENGVSHRDLKPENVLLMGDGTAKIIDFGLSEESRYVRGRVGTDPYCAPEVVRLPAVKNKRRGRRVDGFAADVFSLGLTLVAMVTGRLPWAIADDAADQDYADFVSRLLTYDVEGAVFAHDPAELGITVHLCALLDAMLHPDPRQRATIHDVLAALHLPWFENDLPESANNVSNTGALASPVTNGKCGDLDSGVSAGACSAADVSVDMGERGLGCYGEEEDDDEALGDELPPLPAFLVSH